VISEGSEYLQLQLQAVVLMWSCNIAAVFSVMNYLVYLLVSSPETARHVLVVAPVVFLLN